MESKTRVEALADQLRQRIDVGALRSGDHMTSVRELARNSGVSPFTAARVYELLVAEGLVEARRGSGYYVARTAGLPHGNTAILPPEPLADSIWALRRDCASRSVRVDAGCGWLPPKWLFPEGVRTALTQVSRRPAAYVGRYGSVHGLRPLRRHLATQLAQRSIECTEDQIVLTQGASQGLDLCIGALTIPGETAFVDDPCYPYLLAMLRARGVNVVGVPRTESGPDVDALNSLAVQTTPRIFITNTTLQNPTGTTTRPHVAHGVLLAAERHGFSVIEDDIFSELVPERTPSIAALDRLRRVVYVGSFSKAIAPNLRVGYVACDAEVAKRIAERKCALSLASSELMENIVLSILTSGRHRTHLERLRQRLATAHGNVTRRFASAGVELEFQGGGLFLWGTLPTALDARRVTEMARAQGILLAPGELFRPDGRSTGHFRFNVAYADDEALYKFIGSLPAR